jgi:hypothetical protein
MGDFQIKRGLKQNLFDNDGNLLITPEEGCWYITIDTYELYVCFNGIVSPVGAAAISDLERFDELSERIESIVQNYGYKRSLPAIGEENIVYRVTDENAEYRWDSATSQYYCVGRDYQEIQVIHGGKAE